MFGRREQFTVSKEKEPLKSIKAQREEAKNLKLHVERIERSLRRIENDDTMPTFVAREVVKTRSLVNVILKWDRWLLEEPSGQIWTPADQDVAKLRGYQNAVDKKWSWIRNNYTPWRWRPEATMKTSLNDQTENSLTRVPPRPTMIHNRHAELESIVPLLTLRRRTRVCIRGASGVGKSTLAIQLLWDDRVQTEYGAQRLMIRLSQTKGIHFIVQYLTTLLDVSPTLESMMRALSESHYLLVIDDYGKSKDARLSANVDDLLDILAGLETVNVVLVSNDLDLPACIEWSEPILPPLSAPDATNSPDMEAEQMILTSTSVAESTEQQEDEANGSQNTPDAAASGVPRRPEPPVSALGLHDLAIELMDREVNAKKTAPMRSDTGAFSDVWQGELVPEGRPVAIKVLRISSEDVAHIRPQILREVKIWSKLHHLNVVPFLGVYLERVHGVEIAALGLVSPWMEHGRLTRYLREFPQVDRVGMVDGVADGLAYLHSQNVVHNDLKGANIVVNKEGVPRLIDYGLSSIVDGISTSVTKTGNFNGTIHWLAPERMIPELFGMTGSTCRTPASDLYSFGMVILEVFTDALPYPSTFSSWELIRKIPEGLRPDYPGKVAEVRGMTAAIWDYVQKCWGPHGSRPTAAEWNFVTARRVAANKEA